MENTGTVEIRKARKDDTTSLLLATSFGKSKISLRRYVPSDREIVLGSISAAR